MGTMFCSGVDLNGSKIEVDCDADMNLGVHKNMSQFYVGNLKMNSNEFKFKLNLHNFKNFEQLMISISNESDDLNQNGIAIKNDSCWSRFIKFFIQLTERKFFNYQEHDLTILKIL